MPFAELALGATLASSGAATWRRLSDRSPPLHGAAPGECARAARAESVCLPPAARAAAARLTAVDAQVLPDGSVVVAVATAPTGHGAPLMHLFEQGSGALLCTVDGAAWGAVEGEEIALLRLTPRATVVAIATTRARVAVCSARPSPGRGSGVAVQHSAHAEGGAVVGLTWGHHGLYSAGVDGRLHEFDWLERFAPELVVDCGERAVQLSASAQTRELPCGGRVLALATARRCVVVRTKDRAVATVGPRGDSGPIGVCCSPSGNVIAAYADGRVIVTAPLERDSFAAEAVAHFHLPALATPLSRGPPPPSALGSFGHMEDFACVRGERLMVAGAAEGAACALLRAWALPGLRGVAFTPAGIYVIAAAAEDGDDAPLVLHRVHCMPAEVDRSSGWWAPPHPAAAAAAAAATAAAAAAAVAVLPTPLPLDPPPRRRGRSLPPGGARGRPAEPPGAAPRRLRSATRRREMQPPAGQPSAAPRAASEEPAEGYGERLQELCSELEVGIAARYVQHQARRRWLCAGLAAVSAATAVATTAWVGTPSERRRGAAVGAAAAAAWCCAAWAAEEARRRDAWAFCRNAVVHIAGLAAAASLREETRRAAAAAGAALLAAAAEPSAPGGRRGWCPGGACCSAAPGGEPEDSLGPAVAAPSPADMRVYSSLSALAGLDELLGPDARGLEGAVVARVRPVIEKQQAEVEQLTALQGELAGDVVLWENQRRGWTGGWDAAALLPGDPPQWSSETGGATPMNPRAHADTLPSASSQWDGGWAQGRWQYMSRSGAWEDQPGVLCTLRRRQWRRAWVAPAVQRQMDALLARHRGELRAATRAVAQGLALRRQPEGAAAPYL